MLTRLRIRNFKAWQDTGDLRLAPLTVFFGTNSSGKTSLLQFLLMLKQTVQSLDRRRVLHFGDRRSLVDLGVWPQMVFRQDPGRTLGFELELQLPARYSLTGQQHEGEFIAFDAAIGVLEQGQAPIDVNSFTYRTARKNTANEFTLLGVRHTGNKQYEIWHSGLTESPESHIFRSETIHFNGLQIEFDAPHRILYYEFLARLKIRLDLQLARLRYLGPLRQSPARMYAWAGDTPEDVGLEGERTVEALLAARDRRLQSEGTGHEMGFEVVLAQWLQKMGILETFEINPIAPHRKEYEVLVRAMGMPDAVSLTDVGFGVSQLLPVLVQLLYVERESTLLFEQPELHLHPRAQSALADVFIDALRMREGRESRKLQAVIESHSEHFLRRIQRRIAEEKLKPADVALYFCKPGHEGSTIEELKLDEYGNISNWPENFFGDEVGDLAAMTEAAMKRQLGPEEE